MQLLESKSPFLFR